MGGLTAAAAAGIAEAAATCCTAPAGVQTPSGQDWRIELASQTTIGFAAINNAHISHQGICIIMLC